MHLHGVVFTSCRRVSAWYEQNHAKGEYVWLNIVDTAPFERYAAADPLYVIWGSANVGLHTRYHPRYTLPLFPGRFSVNVLSMSRLAFDIEPTFTTVSVSLSKITTSVPTLAKVGALRVLSRYILVFRLCCVCCCV